uniref:Uncharacterized protein n=2 Tax=Oryza TaxID=4527 RepID=A0A0E0P4N0_ORYRU
MTKPLTVSGRLGLPKQSMIAWAYQPMSSMAQPNEPKQKPTNTRHRPTPTKKPSSSKSPKSPSRLPLRPPLHETTTQVTLLLLLGARL